MALSSQITSDSQGVLRLLRYLANVSQLPKFFAMKKEKCKKSKLSTYFFYIRVPFMYFLFTVFWDVKIQTFSKLFICNSTLQIFWRENSNSTFHFYWHYFGVKIHFSIASFIKTNILFESWLCFFKKHENSYAI